MQQMFSTGQVARSLGLRPYQLEYAHATDQLAEPTFRFLGKRVYVADDVRRAALHFGVTLDDDLKVLDANKEVM